MANHDKKTRKILTVLVDRANYGRLWPVMRAIQNEQGLELQVMCAGSMVLERFGQSADVVEKMGFRVDSKVYMELEGSVPISMAKSVGFGVIEFASEITRLDPDIVLLIGDRYEALAAALATVYSNYPLAHIQGGEISGSIDESARHAITKLAHYHFPATKRSAEYVIRMGERPDTVFPVGCPCGDFIMNLGLSLPEDIFKGGDPSVVIDPQQPYFLVIFHPVTTEFGDEKKQILEVLHALNELRRPTVWLWPNIDAGSDHISKELRRFRSIAHPGWLKFLVNFTPEHFQAVLANAACAIGNSSSFVRDSTFTGVPVVLIGDRQTGRETGRNATVVPADKKAIIEAVEGQVRHGRYGRDTLYGDGQASARIARHLAEVPIYTQKRLAYFSESIQS
jgi:UDP-hydrolysing UDP-N-acetyl-D-glucosamine 2-epimerase